MGVVVEPTFLGYQRKLYLAVKFYTGKLEIGNRLGEVDNEKESDIGGMRYEI